MSRQSSKERYRAGRDSSPFFSDPFQSAEHPIAPHQTTRSSVSSYRHPYDIAAPEIAYGNNYCNHPSKRNSSLDEEARICNSAEPDDADFKGEPDYCRMNDREGRRRGILSNLIEFYGAPRDMDVVPRRKEYAESDSESTILDADDPRMTGIKKGCLDDYEDEKRNALRQMNYRQRRKEKQKVRIEFNITSIINRRHFLLKLARALMTFGAPSHRIESQLVAAARILEVDAEFIHLPGVIVCSYSDNDTMTSETHFVKCSGGLALGCLNTVHSVYRAVVHDEISARKATQQLDDLLSSKPVYPVWIRCILSFLMSALICPLAFGGSFLDMWVSGAGAFVLCYLQRKVASKSAMYASVFEITTAMMMSFFARGLSSIRSQIFCYTAISSAGIIGILPSFLILTSSLELASKNIICGSVKMVYALIYTLFLGFGLQIGSDLYFVKVRFAKNPDSGRITCGFISKKHGRESGLGGPLPARILWGRTTSLPIVLQSPLSPTPNGIMPTKPDIGYHRIVPGSTGFGRVSSGVPLVLDILVVRSDCMAPPFHSGCKVGSHNNNGWHLFT